MKIKGKVTNAGVRNGGEITITGVEEVRLANHAIRRRYFAIDVPEHDASAYPVGRKVEITITPKR